MIVEQLVVRRLVDALEVGQRDGVADAGDDVLALRVLQVVAVDALGAGGGVAGEGHPGAGVVAEVAEDHRAHVDRGAEVGGDALLAAVEDGALGVPGPEDRQHGQVELLARVLREGPPALLLDDLLVASSTRASRSSASSSRSPSTPASPCAAQRLLEQVARRCRAPSGRTSTAAGGRSPRRSARWPPAPASPCTDSSLRPTLSTVSIIPGMEDAAPERTETSSGSSAWPSFLPMLSRARSRCSVISSARPSGSRSPRRLRRGEVGAARLGGDGEPRRDRQTQVGHLGQVGALAPQQVLLVLVALGEVVDECAHGHILHPRGPDHTPRGQSAAGRWPRAHLSSAGDPPPHSSSSSAAASSWAPGCRCCWRPSWAPTASRPWSAVWPRRPAGPSCWPTPSSAPRSWPWPGCAACGPGIGTVVQVVVVGATVTVLLPLLERLDPTGPVERTAHAPGGLPGARRRDRALPRQPPRRRAHGGRRRWPGTRRCRSPGATAPSSSSARRRLAARRRDRPGHDRGHRRARPGGRARRPAAGPRATPCAGSHGAAVETHRPWRPAARPARAATADTAYDEGPLPR